MDQRDLLIKNGKILCMDGDVRADWLLTQGGKIARLGVGKCDPEYISGTVQIIDAGAGRYCRDLLTTTFRWCVPAWSAGM